MKATVCSAWVSLIKAPPQKQTRSTLKLLIYVYLSDFPYSSIGVLVVIKLLQTRSYILTNRK